MDVALHDAPKTKTLNLTRKATRTEKMRQLI